MTAAQFEQSMAVGEGNAGPRSQENWRITPSLYLEEHDIAIQVNELHHLVRFLDRLSDEEAADGDPRFCLVCRRHKTKVTLVPCGCRYLCLTCCKDRFHSYKIDAALEEVPHTCELCCHIVGSISVAAKGKDPAPSARIARSFWNNWRRPIRGIPWRLKKMNHSREMVQEQVRELHHLAVVLPSGIDVTAEEDEDACMWCLINKPVITLLPCLCKTYCFHCKDAAFFKFRRDPDGHPLPHTCPLCRAFVGSLM